MMQQMGYDISTGMSLYDGWGKLAPFEESLSQAQLNALHEDKILKEEKYGLGYKIYMTSVTPDFKIKTRCSSYVCPGSSCHTYGHNVNTETQCLYYINFYYKEYCLYTEDYIDSLIEQQQNNPTPQAIDRGQRKLLEEIFIIVVPLISVF
jgi:hypothetical protein